MIIRLKSGFRVKTDAEKIYQAAEKAKDAAGRVQIDTMIEQARPKRAPIHREFEWDDAVCGVKYRREQCRKLLRAIEVVHEGATRPTRAYEHVVEVQVSTDPADTEKTEQQRVYRSIEDIMQDTALRDQLLARAWREVVGWRQRYSALSELAKIHAAIDAAVLKQDAA